MRQWSVRGALRAGRRSTVARHVSSLWLAEGVVLAAGLVQTVVVARVLGPREYGRAALIMAFPALIYSFFDPNSEEAVVRYMSDASLDGSGVLAVPRLAYLVDAGLAVVGVTIVGALAPFAEHSIVRVDQSASLLLFYAVSLAFQAPLKTSVALLATFDRFGTIAGINSVGSALRIVLVLAFVLSGAGAAGVVLGNGLGGGIQSVVALTIADRSMRRELGASWRGTSTRTLGPRRRNIASFMLYTDVITFLTTLVKQADIVILGWARGPLEAGYYRLALALLSPVSSVVAPMQQVVYPRIARLAGKGNHKEVLAMIRRHALTLGLPVATLVAAGGIAARPLVPAIAGARYQESAGIAQILVLGAAFSVAFYWLRPSFLALGMVRPLFVTSLVAGGATVGGFALAAHPGGAVGVATVRATIAGAFGSLLNAAVFLVLVRRGPVQPPAPMPASVEVEAGS